MPKNELVLLDQVVEERQAARPVRLPDDEAFELFACEEIMRAYDLSADEVSAGIVGGGDDGGIDGVYVFLGDNLLVEDSAIFDDDFQSSKVAPSTRLLLHIIQAKRSESFTETAVDLVSSSTQRLLDLGEPEVDLRALYSDPLVDRIGVFRTALQRLATRHPVVEVVFSYATRGDAATINTKVLVKAKDLEEQLRKLMPDAVGRVQFLGATELWRLASTLPSYTLQLTYRENATSGQSHVALVSLRDYLGFIADEAGTLRRHIFDWNVRDYQGDVEVNREIRESLSDEPGPEFWWLNNGVTVICSKITIVGKTYNLDDVQIVNGLQTSYSIYHALNEAADDHPALAKSVLIRILQTDDPGTRDDVIRATNKQTTVPAASLRATDEVQRSIEAYFIAHGWFYDRRKNYYRNMGKSAERIISIPLLAQAILAIGLSEPNNSRARPSSLLKRDDDYKRIFSNKVDLAVYLWAAKAQKDIDAFLLSDEAAASAPERTNLRFHLAMLAGARLLGEKVHAPAQLQSLAHEDRNIADADLLSCLSELRQRYEELGNLTGDGMDKLAKGQDLVDHILDQAFPAADNEEE